MLRYISFDIGTSPLSERKRVVYTVPDGLSPVLVAVAVDRDSYGIFRIYVNNEEIASWRNETDFGYGDFAPLNYQLSEGDEVIISCEDLDEDDSPAFFTFLLKE